VRLPGFNPVVHLLFREVFKVLSEYFAKNPAVEQEAPDNWDFLIQLNDELLATIAEHPVSPRFHCIYPVLLKVLLPGLGVALFFISYLDKYIVIYHIS
jgi:hypothetical protein